MTESRLRTALKRAADMLDQLEGAVPKTAKTKDLGPMFHELRSILAESYNLAIPETTLRGAAVSSAATARRATEQFILRFRHGDEVVTGWDTLTQRLGMREPYIRVMFSNNGHKFSRLIDGEPCDIIRPLHRQAYEAQLAPVDPGPKAPEPKGVARLKARLESRRFE